MPGCALPEACEQSRISGKRYSRGRRGHGTLLIEQCRRMGRRMPEVKNVRLKQAVVGLKGDRIILTEVAEERF